MYYIVRYILHIFTSVFVHTYSMYIQSILSRGSCSSDNPLGASLFGLTGNKQMRLTKLEINRLVFVFKRPDV